ncbi:MAG: alpha-ketoglutarate-dependent dioxygenase AlkB [Pseudomonadota bacterium]
MGATLEPKPLKPIQLHGATHIALKPAGAVDVVPGWLPHPEADALLARLMDEIDWEQPTITLFGKRHRIPRLQAWIGDRDASYRYSGSRFEPAAWHAAVAPIRTRLADALATPFNSGLANLYRDGDDCMHWHADDERELGDSPCIAPISLGASRDFLLRPRDRHRGNIKVTLCTGDLLIMRGSTQQHWQHAVPRRRNCRSARLNLTFRQVCPQPST